LKDQLLLGRHLRRNQAAFRRLKHKMICSLPLLHSYGFGNHPSDSNNRSLDRQRDWLMVFWFIVLDCAAIVLFMCYIVEFSQMALWKTVPDGVLEAIGDMKKQSRRAAGECNIQTGRFLRIPATWQELQLTAEQRMTEPGQQFLMYHSPTNDILIFAIDARVKLLAESDCWYRDGNFKIVPS
ncbi:hypothetical protein T4A_9451, partial [Trichinella pseudospiralis]